MSELQDDYQPKMRWLKIKYYKKNIFGRRNYVSVNYRLQQKNHDNSWDNLDIETIEIDI